MIYLFIIPLALVCVLVVLVVVIQKPKGGGVASTFASSNQVLGVQKTTDVVERATWVLALSMLTMALLGHTFINNTPATAQAKDSGLDRVLNSGAAAPAPTQQLPQPGAKPQTAPAGQQAAPTTQTVPATQAKPAGADSGK